MPHKIKMCTEKQRYTVKAADRRFVVCTKPFNAKKTFLYFVADLKTGLRGPVNWPYGLPFDESLDTSEGAQKLLTMLNSGEAEHSRRYPPMKITAAEMLQFSSIKLTEGQSDGE